MSMRDYDVFISYSFEDTNDALWLKDVLARAGWTSFLAIADLSMERSDESWSERIVDIISRSGLMLVLASPVSVGSKWVKHEWQTVHRNLLNDGTMPATIITCCIRDVSPDRLKGSLRAFEIVDLRERNRRPETVKRLLDIITGYLQRQEAASAKGQLISILSIEGGGARTLIAGRVLVALEEKIRRIRGESTQLADCFDLISGVSSGCILATLLAHKGVSAAEAVSRYRMLLPSCFRRNLFFPFKPRYQSHALAKALTSALGETRLSQLPVPCLIPTFDLIHQRPLLLGQHRARENSDYDLTVVDAVLAAVSLPIFFEPREVRFPNRLQALLVDACLFARNPTDLAYEEACSMRHPRPRTEDTCILSLGTGGYPASDKPPRQWNFLDWLKEMVGIAMNGSADVTHSTFQRMYESIGLSHRYLRIELESEMTRCRRFRVDDTRRETLDELERIGDELAARFDGRLEEFVEMVAGV